MKPTNKIFKEIDGWLIEVEENKSKLKLTHKSDHFQLRIFAGAACKQIFDVWSSQEDNGMAKIFDSIKTIAEYGLMDAELVLALNKTFIDYYAKKEVASTEDQHYQALEEVKKDYEFKEEVEKDVD